MSGHSKWATTKRKKEAVDKKRGKLFSKLSKVISVAARNGSNPDMNPALRIAIDNAKASSMPKENIERAIQKGSGGGEKASYEEVIYEAFLPGGGAMLIECLTDNKNRALTDIKTVLNKLGGSFASAGSVAYQFNKIGQIVFEIQKNSKSQEDIDEAILSSEADDFEEKDGLIYIYCQYQKLNQVVKKLKEKGIIIDSAEILYISNNKVKVDEEKKETINKIIEAIDDLDDVNRVFSNVQF